MSIHRKISNKKVMMGAALIALSGAVPQPLISQAHAATGTINVSGTFLSGITVAGTVNLAFGSMIASGAAGTVGVKTAGGFTAAPVGVTPLGAGVAGAFKFSAKTTAPNVDVTVAGIGTIPGANFVATGGGAGPVGTVTIKSVTLAGIGAGTTVVAGGGGGGATSGKIAGYDITAKAGPIKVGAVLQYSNGPAIGQFTQPVVLTVAF